MLISLLLPSAFAEPGFSPDRPGYADSTGTVPPGQLQLEGGVGVDLYGGAVAASLPQLLGRYGALDFLELRLAVPDVGISEAGVGLGSVGAGVKLAIDPWDRWSFSAVPMVDVGLRGGVGLDLGLNWAFETTDTLGFSGNVGGSYAGRFGPDASVAFNYAASETVGTYVEGIWFGDDALGAGAGVGFLPSDATQLDLSVTLLGFEGLPLAVGAGVAHLF